MQRKVIAVGHLNPDTDSVLAAFIAARFGKKLFGFEVENRVAGPLNHESKFVWGLLKLPKPKLLKAVKKEEIVLVDTTESSQLAKGINGDNLVAIVDHHNLGGLKSSRPISVRVEPLGSTCSLLYKMLKEKGARVDKTSAKAMMAALISDTLHLTSPTTTAEDKKILRELEEISGWTAKAFAGELFAAKSSLKGIKNEQIIGMDYKNFEMGGKKVGIGVWETTDPEVVNAKQAALMKLLVEKKHSEELDYILFAVVDILKQTTHAYTPTEAEAELLHRVFGVEAKNGMAVLGGVVSRKKQLVPPLMEHFGK